MGRPIQDITLDDDSTVDWQLVPDSFGGVCNWAEVIKDEEDCSLGTRYRLVYKHRGENDMLHEVCIRAQGFVKTQTLGVLGNWNGSARNTEEDLSSIRFRNRVFTKVQPGIANQPRSILDIGDDPEGKAAKVQSQWVVLHPVQYGLEQVTGEQVPCSAWTFQKGDFVDVGFTLDIVTNYVKNKKVTDIAFMMQAVLLLRPACEVQALNMTPDAINSTKKPATILITNSGLQMNKRKRTDDDSDDTVVSKKSKAGLHHEYARAEGSKISNEVMADELNRTKSSKFLIDGIVDDSERAECSKVASDCMVDERERAEGSKLPSDVMIE
ncbi:hypothetical protein PHLCEN_2v6781 [Hermanssonia centrifuga]|uniref:Uncharacterized protein n=1 Tax=Hermanssonia centrifuga TaxID=98765 RepID=A0A2R6NYH4_9APHY|nr:hypothetical protein PHLCEN_2v6781 [Hermanssonia centrifuga]